MSKTAQHKIQHAGGSQKAQFQTLKVFDFQLKKNLKGRHVYFTESGVKWCKNLLFGSIVKLNANSAITIAPIGKSFKIRVK